MKLSSDGPKWGGASVKCEVKGFKPIYADIWQHDMDDWETVNPMECYRFKNGYVQLAKGGYWFPYDSILLYPKQICDTILVNLVKPHVLV